MIQLLPPTLIAIYTIRNNGDKQIKPVNAPMKSNVRFNTWYYIFFLRQMEWLRPNVFD